MTTVVTKCGTCSKDTHRTEDNNLLTVYPDGNKDIKNLLNKLNEPVELNNGNKFRCESCNKIVAQATQISKMLVTPACLLVVIQRT